MRVKTEERRQAIIDTAKKAFATHGFSQTSMASIAKKVGGSKATLYNYFASKEEIYLAVLQTTTAQITQAFECLTTETSAALRTTLIEFGKKYLASICSVELAQITSLAYAEAMNSELGHYFYRNGPEKGVNHLAEFIAAHIEQKHLKACDAKIAAMQLIALLNAELKDPFSLGIIAEPDAQTIEEVVIRAVDGFLVLYAP